MNDYKYLHVATERLRIPIAFALSNWQAEGDTQIECAKLAIEINDGRMGCKLTWELKVRIHFAFEIQFRCFCLSAFPCKEHAACMVCHEARSGKIMAAV